MSFVRVGRVVRSLRRRRGWRQVDLGRRAVCSQQAISLVETGQGDRLAARTLARIAAQLEAEIDVSIRWRGGAIDRLLDESHAGLVGQAAARLQSEGFEIRFEVSYGSGFASGSIDLVAFRPAEAALLVVEVKSELVTAEGTLRKHDEKVRLARQIVADRFGWQARSVSRVLVLPATQTARNAIHRHQGIFDRAYPLRSWELHRWLRHPTGEVSALLFLAAPNPRDTKSVGAVGRSLAPRRVRLPASTAVERGERRDVSARVTIRGVRAP